MDTDQPSCSLIKIGKQEWQIEESAEMNEVTIDFGDILERHDGGPGLASALRKFLQRHPDHIDALHHYGSCLAQAGKTLEALAFAQTAVATAFRILPPTFKIGRDRLPTLCFENRPFLRAVHGLMLAQWAAGLLPAATATGELALALDPDDRMGARESLVLFHILRGRPELALAVFEQPAYRDTFMACEYLHALALISVGKESEARALLRDRCLSLYPQVARFMLEPKTPPPPADDWGIIVGGEFEGWYYAQQFGKAWRADEKALEILQQESRPVAAKNWKRTDEPGQSPSV